MKKQLFTYGIIIALMTVRCVNAQPILIEGREGLLTVNGTTVERLPDGLEFGEAEFSLRSVEPFPVRVRINGVHYDIWDDRVVKASEEEDVHFNMTVKSNGQSFTIESVSNLDMKRIADILLRFTQDVFSFNDHASDGSQKDRDSGALIDDLFKFGYLGSDVFPQDVARMLEISNYLINVHAGSSELFELLRHEVREELETVKMAARVREFESGMERDAAMEELKAKLEDIFSMKQKNRHMEAKYLRQEVERMEELIRERSRAKERLIDARMDELLGTRH